VRLRAATPGDLPFVRALAGLPENQPFISDEPEAALQVYLEAPDCELLIWEAGGTRAGFAILCEIGHPSGRVELMRLALAEPGKGAGRAFLAALLDRAFATHGASRVWLDCSAENPRAAAAYVRAGFREEGRLRNHWYRPALGRTVDLILMGLLRAEWEALAPTGPRA
jgi:RimJ/RimL family protein N-acetyltransferase